MTKIEKLREKTYKDLKEKLDKHGKCALIRPTGFGKTGILTRLLKEYNNVLYLYPSDVVLQAVQNFYGSQEIENTRFITYSKLINLTSEDLDEFGDVDLILCDECHRLGADRTFKAMQTLTSKFNKAHLVGATATPDRMDLIDEINVFFNDSVVYEYTLHNAFKDGVLQKPYYCFCSYGVEDLDYVEKSTRLEVEKMDKDRENALVLLRSRLIEISNLKQMDNIIRTTCSEVLDDTSYLKFIVFFSDFSHISDKGDDVRQWFQDAFPTHSIEVLKITSETKETSENVRLLDRLVHKNNHIDLIFCVDMLNMGYHVNNLTGIAMYRGTESGIIFAQQLGRVLSSGSDKSSLVFDFVDNIHRESFYQVLNKQRKSTQQKQKRREKLLIKLHNNTITDEEKKELETLMTDMGTNCKRWWTHANDLMPEDLIATGYEATYRELIAKTVAEPISMRCRQAWARWVEQGGDDSVMKRDIILAKLPPEFVPLEPFCRLKNVSVNQVLDEMGL